jgi:hypothetical protein
MKFLPSSSHGKLLRGVILLACIAMPLLPEAKGSEKVSGKPWQAVYLAGVAPFPRNVNVQVTIDRDYLRLAPRRTDPFAVPVNAITLVTTNVKGSHPASRAEWRFLEGFTSNAAGCYPPQGCGALVMFTSFLMLASYPMKSHDYLVSVSWREGTAEEEVLFRVGPKDYTTLLAELEKATGKKWKNMDTEWAKVRQEITSQQGSKTSIQLDRKVRVGKFDLKPGAYQVVLLEREAQRGELYFFPGEQVSIEHLSMATWVEIAPAAADAASAPVTFRKKDGITTLDEIHLPSLTVRFP